MFGQNEIVGKKFFAAQPPNTLNVTSMFFTIQGEGPFGGQPALFIRLAKCNLACSFCDTFFDAGDVMTFKQIEQKAYELICGWYNDQGKVVPEWVLPKDADDIEYLIFDEKDNRIRPAANPDDRMGPFGCGLVITGGEPLLQNNLGEFLDRQYNRFAWLQIESNGILENPAIDNPVVTLVCSPKCAEVDGKPTRYLKPSKTILNAANCLKFVMSADPDSPYHTIPDWAFEIRNQRALEIYVSPMNIYNDLPHKAKLLRASKGEITMTERSTIDEVISFWDPGLLNMKANQANHEYTARYALEHGLRFNLQAHLYGSLA